MQFIDLKYQYALLKSDIDAAIQRVLDHGQYLMGPELKEFETRLADYVGVKHVVAVSSGTTALQVALMALDIKPGDEVITTPFSFFATAEVIYLLGAQPVYVDIDPRTYNLNPDLLEAAVTDKTKAIIPVSLYGQCADMDAINHIAAQHDIPVIEDAAQSLGALYKGRQSGSLTEIACTSFHPAKPLGAYGDAGACFTDDDALAERMRCILNHGQQGRYNHIAIGINGRCDTLQAAVLLQKLNVFDKELKLRQQVARWYDELLSDCGGIVKPFIESFNTSSWAQYTVQVDDREMLRSVLAEHDIPTAVHYPKGLHEQPVVAGLSDDSLSFPIAEACGQRVMSLPFYPYMTREMVEDVAERVVEAVSQAV